MKTIYKIFAASAITLLSLAACSKEDSYGPGEAEVDGCYGVYFPSQEASGSHTYDPTAAKSITVTVARSNSNGAITVPVEVTSNVENVFNVAPVTFADGQSETTAEITFPDIEEGVSSTVSLTITDNQYASKYGTGATSLDITILSVAYQDFLDPATGEPALVTFTQDWWGEVHTGYIKYYEVGGVRHCVTYGEQTAATEAEQPNWSYNGGFWGTGEDIHLEFEWYVGDQTVNGEVYSHKNDAGYDIIGLPGNYVYTNSTYNGDVYAWDAYYFYLHNGNDYGGSPVAFEHINGGTGSDYQLGWYDGNGGFYFHPYRYYIDGVGGWSTNNPDIVGIASGFVRTDYSIALSTDLATEGKLPVYLTLGADVDEVKYGVYEGALTAGQIANRVSEISGGNAAGSYTVDANSGFELTLDASGTYTIVALSYAGGAYKDEYAYSTFNYVTAADAETYAPVVSAGTEDVSGRYASLGYDKTNSFGFYVEGTALTDVHIATVATSRYTGNESAYNAAVKADAAGGLAVSADTLALINSEAGYADIMTGLAANTSYTLIVYATNGQQEKYVTAEYTTDGLPNEVIVSGTGAYGYTLAFGGYDDATGESYAVYDEGMNLEYNPNTGEYEIPNWGYGTSFRFSVADDGTVTVPIQVTGFSNSTYGTLYVMDVDQVDTFFGQEGVADYLGYDTTAKGSRDADGNYHFAVAYASTAGYGFGAGEEVFYPEGVPSASASVKTAKRASSWSKPIALPQGVAKSIVGKRAGIGYERQSHDAVSAKVSALTATRTLGRDAKLIKDNRKAIR